MSYKGSGGKSAGGSGRDRGVCSKRLTIDGRRLDFSEYSFWALSADGEAFRVRHYRDLRRTGAFAGGRESFPGFVRGPGPHGVHVLALPKGAELPGLSSRGKEAVVDEIRELLVWAEKSVPGFSSAVTAMADDPRVGLPGAVLGVTGDVRRASNVGTPSSRVLLGEGGLGHRRGPLGELAMLARSDRSSDGFYEPAAGRGERRRALVAKLVREDAAGLVALVSALRTRDRLRAPAVMLAVDMLVAGHPDAERLLGEVLLRPDEPGVALRYFFDAYRGGKRSGVPSALRRAVGAAAVRLYDEDAVVRFDRNRFVGVEDRSVRGRPVRFADVLALTHPVPVGDGQARLFGFLSGKGSATPLLAERARLAALDPAAVSAELAREAARLEAGGAPGLLSRLPWETLASFASPSRAGAVSGCLDRLAEVKRSRAEFQASGRFVPLRRETELRALAREARVQGDGETEARLRAERAALRGSPEFAAADAERSALKASLAAARRDAALAASGAGRVDPGVWAVALPSLSDSQVLSLLGSFDRSGVDDATRARIESRVASSRASIPDVLRTVRGAALASAVDALSGDSSWPSKDASRGSVWRGRGGWAALPASSWEPVLEQLVVERVAAKLPEVKGRVLVLVDGSGSMGAEVSGRSNDQRGQGYQSLTCADVAGFAASAIVSRCSGSVDVYSYDDAVAKVDGVVGVLDGSRRIVSSLRGGGTDTFGALTATWSGHDTVVILTDEQTSFVPGQVPYPGSFYGNAVHERVRFDLPDEVRVVTVNLAGHAGAQFAESETRRSISGWSEALFDEIAVLDALPTPDASLLASAASAKRLALLDAAAAASGSAHGDLGSLDDVALYAHACEVRRARVVRVLPEDAEDDLLAKAEEAEEVMLRRLLGEPSDPPFDDESAALADARVYRVGDTGPAGGIVVFVGGPGESLEVPPCDWNGSEFGDPACSWDDAVRLAQGCTFGGYADWYLPSKAELIEKVYPFTRSIQRHDARTFVHERRPLRSGRDGDLYWSSTPAGAGSANFVWMDERATSTGDRSRSMYVLPVRAF